MVGEFLTPRGENLQGVESISFLLINSLIKLQSIFMSPPPQTIATLGLHQRSFFVQSVVVSGD